MIKGHTKIELTKVADGSKKVIEHDNMLTTGFYNMFKYSALDKSIAFKYFPYYGGDFKHFFGHLYCFKDMMDTDPDHYLMPADNSITASGAIIGTFPVSNNNKTLGIYNIDESGIQSDGSAKIVFDFTTGQGNGTISSICLSPNLGQIASNSGLNGLENNYYPSKNLGIPGTERMFTPCPNSEFYTQLGFYNNYFYMFSISKDYKTLSIYRCKFDFTSNFSYFDDSSYLPVETVGSVAIDTEWNSGYNTSTICYGDFYLYNGFIYCVFSSTDRIVAGAHQLIKISLDDLTNINVIPIYFDNIVRCTQFQYNFVYYNFSYSYNLTFIVDQNYAYVSISRNDDSTGYGIYRLPLNNAQSGKSVKINTMPKNINQLDNEGNLTEDLYLNTGNSVTNYSSTTTKKSKVKDDICYSKQVGVNGPLTGISYDDSYSVYPLAPNFNLYLCIRKNCLVSPIFSLILIANILLTKNNLSTPIEKTNAETMKITYTLTQS